MGSAASFLHEDEEDNRPIVYGEVQFDGTTDFSKIHQGNYKQKEIPQDQRKADAHTNTLKIQAEAHWHKILQHSKSQTAMLNEAKANGEVENSRVPKPKNKKNHDEDVSTEVVGLLLGAEKAKRRNKPTAVSKMTLMGAEARETEVQAQTVKDKHKKKRRHRRRRKKLIGDLLLFATNNDDDAFDDESSGSEDENLTPEDVEGNLSDDNFEAPEDFPECQVQLKSRGGDWLSVSWDIDSDALGELNMCRRKNGKVRIPTYALQYRIYLERPKKAKYFIQPRWKYDYVPIFIVLFIITYAVLIHI